MYPQETNVTVLLLEVTIRSCLIMKIEADSEATRPYSIVAFCNDSIARPVMKRDKIRLNSYWL